MKTIHEPVYERRIAVLAEMLVPHLQPGFDVLDVGCGSGMLGERVLNHPECPSDVRYRGLEKSKRGNEPIEVIEYHSGAFPFEDDAFDVVILADVLHHEQNEAFLLSEAARVSNDLLVIKDHKKEGFLGYWRICFLDWVANNPYQVPCLYRYHTEGEWHSIFKELDFNLIREEKSIDLYPPLLNQVFGKRLQYYAVLQK
ncbi:MAG: methionine biosynthesis protein MetW [Rhodothermales bacterium]|nr:methionine biosynthesis protein MetW [Rhodothermales bacterium]